MEDLNKYLYSIEAHSKVKLPLHYKSFLVKSLQYARYIFTVWSPFAMIFNFHWQSCWDSPAFPTWLIHLTLCCNQRWKHFKGNDNLKLHKTNKMFPNSITQVTNMCWKRRRLLKKWMRRVFFVFYTLQQG